MAVGAKIRLTDVGHESSDDILDLIVAHRISAIDDDNGRCRAGSEIRMPDFCINTFFHSSCQSLNASPTAVALLFKAGTEFLASALACIRRSCGDKPITHSLEQFDLTT